MPIKIKSKNKKTNESNIFNQIKPYIKGVVIGDLFFTIGVIISSLIIYKTDIDSTFVYIIPLIFVFVGAFFCAVNVQKKVGGRGFLTGILSSLPFIVSVLLFVGIILGFKIGVNTLIVVPISILGGFTGGIAAVNKRI